MTEDFHPSPEFRRAVDQRTRQLRRRRHGVVTVTAMSIVAAAIALPLTLTSASTRSTVRVLTAPSTRHSAVAPPSTTIPTSASPTGPGKYLLLRPVYCVIAPYAPPTHPTVTTVAPPATPSRADCMAADSTQLPTTPPSEDVAGQPVILPADPEAFAAGAKVRYVLGPADLTGTAVATVGAATSRQGVSSVYVTLTPQGTGKLGNIAASRYACYRQDPISPPPCSLEAIDLGGLVESAPPFKSANANGTVTPSRNQAIPNGTIEINGDFTPSQASSLAHEILVPR